MSSDSAQPFTCDDATVAALLEVAVGAVGGTPRSGQQEMAEAVVESLTTQVHLAVQAGTGTGKSLAYLVPAIAHAIATDTPVVVSTATLALQNQLVERDLPRLVEALTPHLPRAPRYAILKGRNNYLCLNRINSGIAAEESTEELIPAASLSALAQQVTRLYEFAEDTERGDRDELNPGVSDRAWRQVSVSSKECLGATRCPEGPECFAEAARDRAHEADIVITNHALLAIDALSEFSVLPEHAVVIIDEAHELVDRMTNVATADMSLRSIEQLVKRAAKFADDDKTDALLGVAEELWEYLEALPQGLYRRWERGPQGSLELLTALRDTASGVRTAVGPAESSWMTEDPAKLAAHSATITGLGELQDHCQRMLDVLTTDNPAEQFDVVWLERDFLRVPRLVVAPVTISGLLRERLFAERTVVLTSATLAVGGNFSAVAQSWGLPKQEGSWRGLDVGSPFDYPRAGILYIATDIPAPQMGQLDPSAYDTMHELMTAAGGRTLGLFSSMRAATEAAEQLRECVPFPILLQGEDSTGTLVQRFAAEEEICLFGTLSLWQGVDVPGRSLSLVMIDRIPFPRPDDPLMTARQQRVQTAGGNGFMAVAATHAALLLAQGVGRLIRSTSDRGVVAVLDQRLVTARYGSFLRALLPPMWETTDRDRTITALRRLVS